MSTPCVDLCTRAQYGLTVIMLDDLNPGQMYLLGCEAGSWKAVPLTGVRGEEVRHALRAVQLLREGSASAAIETLRKVLPDD